MANLLMHSMSEFSDIVVEILAKKQPRTIVEIGSEYGGSTKVLLGYAKNNDAHLHVIDPSPYVDLKSEFSGFDNYYTHHKLKSIDALKGIPPADIYFIDGDHNYWTVINELKLIFSANSDAWVFLHDVAYPWGRRDLYYKPSDIPGEFVNEYTYNLSLDSDNNIVDVGFYGAGAFAFAKEKNTPRNGVLTAVEDHLSSSDSLYFSMIDPIFGLGGIVPKEYALDLDVIFSPYQTSLIKKMEKNRLELYVRVIQLQQELVNARSSFMARVMKNLKKVLFR